MLNKRFYVRNLYWRGKILYLFNRKIEKVLYSIVSDYVVLVNCLIFLV